MEDQIYPVILAGGSGTRLWPQSSEQRPKQFLKLPGEGYLFRNTVSRIGDYCGKEKVRVVCGASQKPLICRDLNILGLSETQVIDEPIGRNTAPAILLACLSLMADGEDPLMIILPADHRIGNTGAFFESLTQAVNGARAGSIVTLGIVPDRPETGYGYIETQAKIRVNRCAPVHRFVEKPALGLAREYCQSGRHLWNAGIFVFRASCMAEEIAFFQPEIDAQVRQYLAGDCDAFSRAPKISIDYAVMEHTAKAAVVPTACDWSDLGTWSAVANIQSADRENNVAEGKVHFRRSQGNFVLAQRPVALIDCHDLIVVEGEGGILVCKQGSDQDVGHVAKELIQDEALTDYRPWGSYTILDSCEGTKTKKLTILPGKRTSLQSHKHRLEQWTVISGEAKVCLDNETLYLKQGQQITIPLGAVHRLENPGQVPLCIIEVQLGDYLGEDDIVRYADDYGRIGCEERIKN